ncbi:hypothetical protein [Achromobacter dolens]|uniref:hypothetical protein n=1 Tax=Achromobacter dolens TaxID=1287738 RepID=UPI001465F5F0|nr:hypothetical protein [Achromobacter dolens]CAB3675151.1 hypothetical protein LMG26840_04008 [Achromobacter dolens]
MGWCESLEIRSKKILKDCRKLFRDEWKFFVCLGAASFSGAFVASLHGWQFATTGESWWQIVSAVATAAAVGVSLWLARRGERLSEMKQAKFGRVLASRIHAPLSNLKRDLMMLGPAIGAFEADPASLRAAIDRGASSDRMSQSQFDAAHAWRTEVLNAIGSLDIDQFDRYFEHLFCLPGTSGIELVDVFGRIEVIKKDCRDALNLFDNKGHPDFVRLPADRAFKAVMTVLPLLEKCLADMKSQRAIESTG